MAVTLNMGIEGVSYQPSSFESSLDYPRHKVNLPVGASIPCHSDEVFNLYSRERMLAEAIRPSLGNPYVTAPANYVQLFGDIETASARHIAGPGDTGRILQSARTLLLAMKENFEAFATARNALIGV